MSEELLPCPFCGGAAQIFFRETLENRQVFKIGCSDEDCFGYKNVSTDWGVTTRTVRHAVGAWNRRTPIQFTSDNLRAITDKEAGQ